MCEASKGTRSERLRPGSQVTLPGRGGTCSLLPAEMTVANSTRVHCSDCEGPWCTSQMPKTCRLAGPSSSHRRVRSEGSPSAVSLQIKASGNTVLHVAVPFLWITRRGKSLHQLLDSAFRKSRKRSSTAQQIEMQPASVLDRAHSQALAEQLHNVAEADRIWDKLPAALLA